MIIHLDTNVIATASRSGTPAALAIQRWTENGDALDICSIVWAEYLCGPFPQSEHEWVVRAFPQPEPILAADAERAALLFNKTGRRKQSLADCRIAAVAIRCGVPLATGDAAHFKAYEPHGLNLIEIA